MTMRFRVENLGPLREAEVDLSKDLIVLTGPNNSGKTYLAWSVYGLYRRVPKVDTGFIDPLSEKLLSSQDQSVDRNELMPYWQEFLSIHTEKYTAEIHQCFAAERELFRRTKISIDARRPWSFYKGSFDSPTVRMSGLSTKRWHINLIIQNETFRLKVDLRNVPSVVGVESTPITPESLVEEHAEIRTALSGGILHALYLGLAPCTLFPAERIAVNIFAKELALKRTELVDDVLDAHLEGESAEPLEMIERRAGRYPWPIRDSLEVANDLAEQSKKKSPFADLAEELEAAVLGGQVSVSSLGQMMFSPAQAAERRLSVHLTASVVKSLASLVFYFRHMARPGHFLIIDEPELNLHPDNQRKIARILAKAVNRGFKIMVSTHSDYFIRELNHLIMLSRETEVAARLVDELGYDRASLLRPEQVGVYLFNEQRAQAVPVTESGFEVKTIDDEIGRINAVSQRIYAELID